MNLLKTRLAKYDLPQRMMERGIYPYFRQIVSKQGTEVEMDGKDILMFGSNAYTGLKPESKPFANMVQVVPVPVFSTGRSTSTSNWKKSWPPSSEKTRRSASPPDSRSIPA